MDWSARRLRAWKRQRKGQGAPAGHMCTCSGGSDSGSASQATPCGRIRRRVGVLVTSSPHTQAQELQAVPRPRLLPVLAQPDAKRLPSIALTHIRVLSASHLGHPEHAALRIANWTGEKSSIMYPLLHTMSAAAPGWTPRGANRLRTPLTLWPSLPHGQVGVELGDGGRARRAVLRRFSDFRTLHESLVGVWGGACETVAVCRPSRMADVCTSAPCLLYTGYCCVPPSSTIPFPADRWGQVCRSQARTAAAAEELAAVAQRLTSSHRRAPP